MPIPSGDGLPVGRAIPRKQYHQMPTTRINLTTPLEGRDWRVLAYRGRFHRSTIVSANRNVRVTFVRGVAPAGNSSTAQKLNSRSPDVKHFRGASLSNSPAGIIWLAGLIETMDDMTASVGREQPYVHWNNPRPRYPYIRMAVVDAPAGIGINAIMGFTTVANPYNDATDVVQELILSDDPADVCRKAIYGRRPKNRSGHFWILGNYSNDYREFITPYSNSLAGRVMSVQGRRVEWKSKRRRDLGSIIGIGNDGVSDVPFTSANTLRKEKRNDIMVFFNAHRLFNQNEQGGVTAQPAFKDNDKLFLNKIEWEEENIWQGGEYNFLIPLFAPTGGNFLIELTEATILADIIVKFPQIVRDEIITLIDTIAKETRRAFGEVLTLVDTVQTVLVIVREFLETIVLADSISKLTSTAKTEAIALADTIVKATTKVLTDPIVLVDAISKFTTAVRTETITLIDTIAKLTSRVLTDVVTVIDQAVEAVFTRLISIGNFILRSIYRAGYTVKESKKAATMHQSNLSRTLKMRNKEDQ